MALSKCVRCKKIFNKISLPVCMHCEAAEEADFAKIHEVLRTHPGARAKEIAEHAEVDIECVMRMLDGGRLTFQENDDKPTCGRCGAPAISASKRLCEACLVVLDRECAEAMRGLQKDYVLGPEGTRKKAGVSVLGEKREELEAKKASETLKRAKELEERAHPGKASPTVARDAREKKHPR